MKTFLLRPIFRFYLFVFFAGLFVFAQSNSIAAQTSSEQRTGAGLDNFAQSDSPTESKDPASEGRKGIFQKLSLDLSWVPSAGSDGMGLTRFNTSATFALPGPRIRQYKPSFFLLSPNFGYTSVDWNRGSEFPNSLYNAGLNITWFQPINERWSGMLSVSPGWASDAKESKDSVRCPVVFGLTWTPNNRWKVVFGAAYLDRSDISFLPYGGLIWKPYGNEDVRLELMAPQARFIWRSCMERFAEQFADPCTVETWHYVGGGFGGGTWAIRSENDQADLAMYREYSLVLGCERVKKGYYTCNFEIAYLFGRRMEFDKETQSTYKPDDSLHLRVKFTF